MSKYRWHITTCPCAGKTYFTRRLNRADVLDCDVVKTNYIADGRRNPPMATHLFHQESKEPCITLGGRHKPWAKDVRYVAMIPSEERLRANYNERLKRLPDGRKDWNTYFGGLKSLKAYAKNYNLKVFDTWEKVIKHIDDYEANN